jgi:2-polyprenyl-3-methyl-5-hydroxy-6-metoxy-1,4-benzoquinol methylase
MEWKNTFSVLYEQIYRNSFSQEENISHAKFVADFTPLKGYILDIPCGDGRVSFELAKLGFNVYGIDLYNASLAKDKLKAFTELRDRVTFESGDMRSYTNHDIEFDTGISLFSSFGYFEHKENVATLKTLVSAIKNGGKIIIDVRNPVRTYIEMAAHNWKIEIPNHKYKGVSVLDPMTGIHTFTYTVDGSIVNAGMRHYFLQEFVDMLNDQSCKVLEVLGDFKKNIYIPKSSPRMIIVAEKA